MITFFVMDWLNYHHLRYFWVVANEGSLAAAAKKLNVSQPSISAQIRELELSLGEKLFERKGRRNVLTDAGRIALRHADEIFSIGQELITALKQRPDAPAFRLFVGVADSLPKLVTYTVLKPVWSRAESGHIVFREGKIKDLLEELGAHRIDILLSDEPATSISGIRAFNHPLGESGTSFCATPAVAAILRRQFPSSLHRAPALLPVETNTLRRSLEQWFSEQRVEPRVLAEFEDPALMKVAAAHGEGFVALPTVVVDEASSRYGLEVFGVAEECCEKFYAITAERRITHPLVSLIRENARKLVFA